jgi:hypothetical protein
MHLVKTRHGQLLSPSYQVTGLVFELGNFGGMYRQGSHGNR